MDAGLLVEISASGCVRRFIAGEPARKKSEKLTPGGRMTVEKTEKDTASLVGQVSSGEIRLPEIQRGYVWKPTQVAKLIESLYRGYPSGSLLLWRTSETPETRSVATNAPTVKPAVLPLYLLDGQQRLTSLHRVFTDHADAQIVFNVETEVFQNQSAATRKDPRWVKVHDLLCADADLFEVRARLLAVGLMIDSKEIGRRINRIAAIPNYGYHMEIITGLSYEEVAQIFVRVNSGGRTLRTTDLALATLSARWPGVLRKIEEEADYWRERGYCDLDITFITRALTGAVLGRGLSAWSHGRLAAASDGELEKGWTTVRRGLRHLVPLLKQNLGVTHSRLLPSVNVLLPLVVLLGERPDEPLDAETANGVLYWFLVATIGNRYSGAADTLLGQDIPAAREKRPVKTLLTNLGVVGMRIEVSEQAIAGRSVTSPYFFVSFLVAQRNSAKDWWHGTSISADAQDSQKLQYHHIHPRATLKSSYSKAEINDLANLAFISGKANQKISNRAPGEYFPSLGEQELAAHFVPLDESLRHVSNYRGFMAARRRLLADAMTVLLDSFRPAWLDQAGAIPSDDIEGVTVDFALYESSWEDCRLLVNVQTPDTKWTTTISVSALELALEEAGSGIESDLAVGGEIVAVNVINDDIEIPLGPIIVFGTQQDWAAMLDRERADAEPISQCPSVPAATWNGERHRRFPVTSSD
ncbi:MAG: GmrSD restriction endonuclease domain-containing protein [Pseudonocardiaceae bacterium]